MDGNTAVIMCERESSDAAGAYPITPSTQMGEYWAEAAASGHINISGRPLIFIEPEGEHAAAAVTAGLSMTGLRAANFSSGQGIAYMHESLYAAVGKRLTYVLNIGARAMTKATLNVHAGHDDYHCIDDTGFFQMFAKNAQSAADLNIIAHRIAELALTPGIVAQDGFLTTHLIESMMVPERELIAEYLGRPDDIIETPTPAQRIIYGETRRRIPMLWDVDNPVMAGLVQNQDSYMQSVAAQRPFFFDHIQALTEQAFDEFYALTGRRYERVMTYRADDADYLILGQGSLIPTAEAVADYLRETRGLKVGVVNLVMFRPFPGDLLGQILQGKKGVAVLERLDQPLAVDLPLMREIRATRQQVPRERRKTRSSPAYPELATYASLERRAGALLRARSAWAAATCSPRASSARSRTCCPTGQQKKLFYLSIDFLRDEAVTPKQEIYQQTIEEAYPKVKELAVRGSENPNLMPEGQHHGALPLGRRLGRDHHGQEPGDDAVRPARLPHQGQPEVRLGEEGPADHLLPVGGAGADPHQLRVLLRRRRALARPERLPAHQRAGRPEGRRRLHHPERQGVARRGLGEHPADVSRRSSSTRRSSVFYLDAFKIAREEATDPELQLRMQGIAFQGAFFAASPVMEQAGLDEEKLLEAIRDQLQHKFGAQGRARRRGQHARGEARLRRDPRAGPRPDHRSSAARRPTAGAESSR